MLGVNVFVLGTGRCGSVAFAAACAHLENFTTGHESRARLIGSDRLDYPDGHIEVDNRLSWFLGSLADRFGHGDVRYVHLVRDESAVVDSFVRRWDSPFRASIIRAFGHGIVMRTDDWADSDIRAVCECYVRTVKANIDHFIRQHGGVRCDIEACPDEFEQLVRTFGAEGDFDAARAEFGKGHNATSSA